jgi:BNR repeat-containing family member
MHRRRLIALAIVLLVTAADPVWGQGAPTSHGLPRRHSVRQEWRGRTASRSFATWGQGSWCWFGDPRAAYVSGRYDEVFVGWLDWFGGVTVGAYDPRLGVRHKRVIGYEFHDDHGGPSILVEARRRLTVFWSGHDGASMYYRSTLRPADITAWGPLQQVPSNVAGSLGFTYPNPVLLPAEDNTLYLFWRGADWSEDYATRTVAGRWSQANELIRVPGQRPYLKVDSNGRDTIALAWTDGHPRETLSSIYFAAYRAGSLWTAGGHSIGRMPGEPITLGQADLVYNAQASRVPAWVWDVAVGPDRRPVIVYATFPSPQHNKYWYADWTGTRWVSHFLTSGGGTISPGGLESQYSGGIELDHSDPSIVYLSRHARGGFEIERWATDDRGLHWRHTTVVPAGGTDNVRPVVPRGWDHGPMSLLWLRGNYGSYTQYRTSIAYLR